MNTSINQAGVGRRLRSILDQRYGGSIPNMSTSVACHASELRSLCHGTSLPDHRAAQVCKQVLAAHPDICPLWLYEGVGPMTFPKDGPAPKGATTSMNGNGNGNGSSSLDLLLDLGGRIKALEQRAAAAPAVPASITQSIDTLKKDVQDHQADTQERINAMKKAADDSGRNVTRHESALVAHADRIKELGGGIAELRATLDEMRKTMDQILDVATRPAPPAAVFAVPEGVEPNVSAAKKNPEKKRKPESALAPDVRMAITEYMEYGGGAADALREAAASNRAMLRGVGKIASTLERYRGLVGSPPHDKVRNSAKHRVDTIRAASEWIGGVEGRKTSIAWYFRKVRDMTPLDADGNDATEKKEVA